MRVEYDSARDLLDVWLSVPGTRAARTETLAPGVHADFDAQGKLIGLKCWMHPRYWDNSRNLKWSLHRVLHRLCLLECE